MTDPKPKQIIRMPDHTDCPHCGRRNNAHSGDGIPQTGDWSICYGCHRISRFVNTGGEISLRAATRSELVEFAHENREDAEVLARGNEDLAAALRELDGSGDAHPGR